MFCLRFQTVRDYLDLALRASEQDTEYVHQLRVGTRRAGAALEIFSLCLPKKSYQSARKYLRTMRRAAGQARDCDVFLEALAAETNRPARQRPGLDFLFGHALVQREQAQAHLLQANPHFPTPFVRFEADTLCALRPPGLGDMTLMDLGRPVLLELLRGLTLAATQDLHDYEHLHQVRILGKRLRYAMEVFADCFPPEFRTVHYAAVEEMQEILGCANDSFVATNRLRDLSKAIQARLSGQWKRLRPGIEGLLRFHERAAAAGTTAVCGVVGPLAAEWGGGGVWDAVAAAPIGSRCASKGSFKGGKQKSHPVSTDGRGLLYLRAVQSRPTLTWLTSWRLPRTGMTVSWASCFR